VAPFTSVGEVFTRQILKVSYFIKKRGLKPSSLDFEGEFEGEYFLFPTPGIYPIG
jgi:hypothetical protein